MIQKPAFTTATVAGRNQRSKKAGKIKTKLKGESRRVEVETENADPRFTSKF
jgi:hypothetical protein